MFHVFFKPSVLLIDDDLSISLLAKARLMSHENYKIILGGLDVLRQLKTNGKTRAIPVIMMTGKNMMRDIEQAFSSGAEAYITKPLDLKKLSNKVNLLISK